MRAMLSSYLITSHGNLQKMDIFCYVLVSAVLKVSTAFKRKMCAKLFDSHFLRAVNELICYTFFIIWINLAVKGNKI